MARRLIDIKFEFGNSQKNIQRYIEWFEFAKRIISYHLKKLNPEKMQEIMVKSATETFANYRMRVDGKRMKLIMRGFRGEYKQDGNKTMVTAKHQYLSGHDGVFRYTTPGGKSFSIKGSAILNILDEGRGQYQIPRPENTYIGQILRWKYGSVQKKYEIKSMSSADKGGPIVVRKFNWERSANEGHKVGGTRFIERVRDDLLAYVASVQADLKKAVKQKEARL